MKNKVSKHNWFINAFLFGGLILMFFMELTGVALHQWIGIANGVLAVYHFLTHWNWIDAVSKRFFRKTSNKARLYYLFDTSLLLGFASILATGLLISTWLSLNLANMRTWISLHEAISIVTLLIVILKIAVHWRWIVKTTRIIFERPTIIPFNGRYAIKSGTLSINSQRRDFLKLMGIVSAASVVALINIRDSAYEAGVKAASAQSEIPSNNPLESSSSAEFEEIQVSAAQPTEAMSSQPLSTSDAEIEEIQATTSKSVVQSNTQVSTSANIPVESSSVSCQNRCRKGKSCSYPGECHDYRDSNGNGLCDNGECV